MKSKQAGTSVTTARYIYVTTYSNGVGLTGQQQSQHALSHVPILPLKWQYATNSAYPMLELWILPARSRRHVCAEI